MQPRLNCPISGRTEVGVPWTSGSEVRAVSKAHGVDYKSDTWPKTLKKALGRVASLSLPRAHEQREAA